MPRLALAAGERVHQRRHDARTGRADRVPERTGAAMHVDPCVLDADVTHGGHRHDRERFVDFVQIDVLGAPAEPLQCLLDRADGRRREPLRLLSVARVGENARQGL